MCTSSNARAVLEWALAKGDKVLFFPDQHLGRNTGFTMGYGEADMRVWNPHPDCGGLEERDVKDATLLLVEGPLLGAPALPARARRGGPGRAPRRRGHRAPRVRARRGRARRPGRVDRADPGVGRATRPRAPRSRSRTEIHMVQRLAREHADKTIFSLDPLICPCSTMFRIDGPHLAWVLENLVAGNRRESDRRRRRHRRMGTHRARTDARHHLSLRADHQQQTRDRRRVAVLLGAWRGSLRAASALPCAR